jgi:hypothetical protein
MPIMKSWLLTDQPSDKVGERDNQRQHNFPWPVHLVRVASIKPRLGETLRHPCLANADQLGQPCGATGGADGL